MHGQTVLTKLAQNQRAHPPGGALIYASQGNHRAFNELDGAFASNRALLHQTACMCHMLYAWYACLVWEDMSGS